MGFPRVDDKLCGYALVLECTEEQVGLLHGHVLILLAVKDEGGGLQVLPVIDRRKFLVQNAIALIGVSLLVELVPGRETTLAMEAEPVRDACSHHRGLEAVAL